jgi:hypothetical protein
MQPRPGVYTADHRWVKKGQIREPGSLVLVKPVDAKPNGDIVPLGERST